LFRPAGKVIREMKNALTQLDAVCRRGALLQHTVSNSQGQLRYVHVDKSDRAAMEPGTRPAGKAIAGSRLPTSFNIYFTVRRPGGITPGAQRPY
jgi:hypothetical protein